MSLVDKYGGKSIRIGLIARYVSKKPEKKGKPINLERAREAEKPVV